MACPHRFINDLYPAGQLKYLFVGTFNPSWDRLQNDNANWFYGRQYNDFWFIMPQVFGHQNLMHRDFRTNRQFLMNWCIQNNIGLTDLIANIQDADINNDEHRNIILGVNDNAFDTFEQIIPTDIQTIITANATTLCGVYLTRYEHTLLADGIINNLWNNIKETCNNLNIHCHDLVTPSRQFRALTRIQKLNDWTNTIQICT
jgi:G:T/U-mismatch repair DNA glycosylase